MSAGVRCFLLLGCLLLVSLEAPRASATLHEDVARTQAPGASERDAQARELALVPRAESRRDEPPRAEPRARARDAALAD